jgi:hypothetical protein
MRKIILNHIFLTNFPNFVLLDNDYSQTYNKGFHILFPRSLLMTELRHLLKVNDEKFHGSNYFYMGGRDSFLLQLLSFEIFDYLLTTHNWLRRVTKKGHYSLLMGQINQTVDDITLHALQREMHKEKATSDPFNPFMSRSQKESPLTMSQIIIE